MTRRQADEQTGKGFVIEEVTDIHARWDDIEPMLLAMVESQRPHDTRTLRPDWAPRWREHLTESSDALFLVARDAQGRHIAFLNGNVTRDYGVFDEVYAYVGNTYVEPRMRRRRVATALVERFEHWSHERGATSIRLDVVAGNNDGFVFWAATGYVPSRFELEKPLEAEP